MNIYLPTKAKDIKGNVAISELKRAHLIIAALALALAVIIIMVSANQIQFDALLGSIAAALLLLVAAVSLGTIYAMRKR